MSNYQLTQSVVQGLLKDKNTIIDKFNSNRIVSIPQDIKLELNDGTLILKAGSKVYVPKGFEADGTTPKFDEVVVASDVQLLASLTSTYVNGNYSWCYNKDLNKIQGGNNVWNQIQSNTYDNSAQYCMFYDTTNNIIKYTTDYGATWETGYSLCFCITELTNGVGNVSIDKVFNGFGYIGSTCYILPGITGYIPQGLNSDGTLINEIITQTKVSCTTVTSPWGTGSELFFFNGIDSYIHRNSKNCFYQATQPIVNDVDNYWYNTETGKFYETKNSGSYWSEFKAIPAFTITFDEGKITSLKSCGVHELVNSNATNLSDYGRQVISGLGKPSSKYIDLTVGASGTTYIAPMNGYLYCNGHANASPAYISIDIPNLQYCGINGDVGHDLTTNQIALKNGDKFTLRYSNTTINAFRFVYDEGCS